ncbi:hypothetical protein [Mucilaginibacter sp. L196]|uniref:hypothetical protein n=1 Tax=Mucilaginibacter sp. L196 TaxID=1641870 RepID=UPI00131BA473|nr:hypothetical protein [Mucilaginibacter sp. L196]
MKNKLLLIVFFVAPFISQAQVKTVIGNDIVSLKTFTTVLGDAVRMEKLDDYFKPLGYKFTGMENISRHGMQGHQLTYMGDHSDFRIDLVNRLKLNVLYETASADEYNTILTDLQTSNGYKIVDDADSGLTTSITFANSEYLFVFMTRKTQNGMQYSINASSKVSNLVVNDGNNQ